MSISNRFLIIFMTLILSGCYSFEKAPYTDEDLKPLSSTEFGKAVIKYASKIPDTEYTEDLKKTISGDTSVREISSDFLVTQSKEDGMWQISVMMRNNHHIMFCSMMESEINDIPKGVKVAPIQGALTGGYSVSGSENGMKNFADLLAATGPKLCISIPYADPRKTAGSSNGSASSGGDIIDTVFGTVGSVISTITSTISDLISSVLG